VLLPLALLSVALAPELDLWLLGEGATDLGLDCRALDDLEDPRPRERVGQVRLEVGLRVALDPSPRWRAVATAFVSGQADQERPIDESRYLVVNGRRGRSLFEERLGETHLEWLPGAFSLRTGKQYIHWGALPVLSPNDTQVRVDLGRGPFPRSADRDLPLLPLWAARAQWERGWFALDGVWTPFFQPHRLTPLGDDFALFGAQVMEDRATRALVQAVESSRYATTARALNVLREGEPQGLDSGGAGLRLIARGNSHQLAFQYDFGFDPYPAVQVNAPLLDRVRQYYEQDPQLRDPRTGFDEVVAALVEGEAFWTARYRRSHHLGLTGELSAGDFQVAGELSFTPRTTVLARSGRAADARLLSAAAALTYAPAERLVLWTGLQAAKPYLQGPRADLLYGWTSRALVAMAGGRVDLGERWRFEALAFSELERRSYAATATAGWRAGRRWDLYLAIDLFGGTAGSLGRTWDYNDQVAVGARLRL
jgi:hypothetical protein